MAEDGRSTQLNQKRELTGERFSEGRGPGERPCEKMNARNVSQKKKIPR